jgi:hypothetical protein
MKEIKIYYAPKYSKDIQEIEVSLFDYILFEDFKQMLKQCDDRKTVYLITFKKQEEEDTGLEKIRITHCNYEIIELLGGLFNWKGYDIFLQEYESFEDAYSVALSMREPSELCYSVMSE